MLRPILLLGLTLLTLGQGTAAPAADKLNVLFLMSDDLRPELSGYGHPTVQTPNIDALGRAGVRFERAYCQYPLCNPSRTSLLTGRYPTTTGVLDNTRHFRDDHPEIVTLPQHFKNHGYVALRTGKIFHGGLDDTEAWTEGGEPRRTAAQEAARKKDHAENYRSQSDRFVVLEGDGQSHGDYKTADKAIAFLQQNKDRPFFLACGFSKPHSAPTAPQRFYDLYDVSRVPLPVDFASTPTVPAGFPAACLTPNGDLFIGREASKEEARVMIRAYWASLTWVDWNVGRVVAELDRLGLRDNTVIVFWGDHGYHLGEKGKWAKHGSLFEIGARVPQIIIAPGAAGNGTSCNRIVETLDIYLTLVELCGLPAPEGLEGDSLVPLLQDPGASWDKPAFTVTTTGRGVRTDRWRYAEWPGPKGGAMLIDEQNDPHELKNLADDPQYQDVRKRLSSLLQRLEEPVAAR